MFKELCGSDWSKAFECCGLETQEQRERWDPGAYVSEYRDNQPKVSTVLGCDARPDSFTRDDVAELIASSDGERDERDWVAVMKLKDGRFAFLTAGCDYTGWDCQSWGCAFVADNLERLWQYGIDERARTRLSERVEEYLSR